MNLGTQLTAVADSWELARVSSRSRVRRPDHDLADQAGGRPVRWMIRLHRLPLGVAGEPVPLQHDLEVVDLGDGDTEVRGQAVLQVRRIAAGRTAVAVHSLTAKSSAA